VGGLHYGPSSSQELPGSAADRNLVGLLAQEKKQQQQQRMLTKDGVFVSRDILNNNSLGDMSSGDGVRPRFEGEKTPRGQGLVSGVAGWKSSDSTPSG